MPGQRRPLRWTEALWADFLTRRVPGRRAQVLPGLAPPSAGRPAKSPWKVAAEFDVDRGHALSNRGQQVASPCLVGRGPAEAGAQGLSRMRHSVARTSAAARAWRHQEPRLAVLQQRCGSVGSAGDQRAAVEHRLQK